MSGEHTPGPWTRDGLTIKTSRGVIAACPVPQAGGVFDCQANATLIAAAAELVEALKEARAWFPDSSRGRTPEERGALRGMQTEMWDQVDAALAKATGAT